MPGRRVLTNEGDKSSNRLKGRSRLKESHLDDAGKYSVLTAGQLVKEARTKALSSERLRRADPDLHRELFQRGLLVVAYKSLLPEKQRYKYLREKALPQVREILTQYGPLGIIWFDGVGTKTAEQNEQIIAMVRTLQPDCLINSRLGDWKKFVWGDYRSMDDDKVADELLPYGWENPGTMNGTYAYKSTETHWRSHTQIIQMLADIAPDRPKNDFAAPLP